MPLPAACIPGATVLRQCQVKTILFMRHGQADPDQSRPDMERPLTGLGRRDVRRMGGLLRRLGIKPDGVVCSPALRARDTAAIAAKECGCTGEVLAELRLYQAQAADYLEVLRGLPARAGLVLVVGHVPAIRQAAAALLGGGSGSLQMAPAATACLEAPIDDWTSLQTSSCALRWLVAPELPAAFR